MNTINIVDYRISSPTLAKVVVSFTGAIDSDFIREELGRKLGNMATVVQSSFKQIQPGVAVGFLRANRAIRTLTESGEALTAKYRVMSSNILMDTADKSLWDMKVGASGKYLTRRGQEDLTALVQASIQRRPDVPRLDQITIAKAAPSELVAFVDDTGDLDHGFAVATSDDKVRVVSYARRIPVVVDYDRVVSIYPVSIPASIHRQVSASLTSDQKKQAKDYYTRLYSYSPDYLSLVLKQIDDSALA